MRTGCLTCKIRRVPFTYIRLATQACGYCRYCARVADHSEQVKCDETKPSCAKCTSTGRKCDGYVAPSSPKEEPGAVRHEALVNPTKGPILHSVNASVVELRGLEYFCVKLAPSMGMYFDADFWNQSVVQASVAEPAVRHAIVALGVLAKQRELLDTAAEESRQARPCTDHAMATIGTGADTTNTVSDDILALRNYNRSIGQLARYMASTSQLTETTLLACVLFVCIEFIRGDESAARRHFQGGLAIIMDRISSYRLPGGTMVTCYDNCKAILPIFNRLEMLSMLFGNDPAWPYPVPLLDTVPAMFDSLTHARDSIVHLMNLSLRYIRRVFEIKYSPSTTPAWAVEEQQALLLHLSFWHQCFIAYRSARASELSAADRYASNVLEISRIVAKIWVSTALSPFECTNDDYMSDFETAVTLAEELQVIAGMHDRLNRYSTTFTLDVEMIGPIHWISLKCRDPVLRRRAVAVLRTTRRREGVWDSLLYAALAERVIEIEEAGRILGEWPREEVRVHHSGIEQTFGTCLHTHVVTLRLMPYGVYSEMVVRQEQISAV